MVGEGEADPAVGRFLLGRGDRPLEMLGVEEPAEIVEGDHKALSSQQLS